MEQNLNLWCKQHIQLSEPETNSYFETKSLNMSIYQQERRTDSHVFGNELMLN